MAEKRRLEPARYAVVGSRNFEWMGIVAAFVSKLPKGSTVISGAASGVDSVAEHRARLEGLEVVSYPADWSQGRGAGIVRNARIVADADIIVAFWDGSSPGTLNSIERGRKAGKPVWICRGPGKWQF